MKFLSLDSSTKYSVVSILDENGLIYGQRRFFEKTRSEGLLNLIKSSLLKTKTKIEALEGLGVGLGPGSFTGLRIGLAAIKGLSFALKIPCYCFSSLDAIAYNEAPLKGTNLCVCVDARRLNIYSRFYKVTPGDRDQKNGLKRASRESLLTLDSLLEKVSSRTVFSGDAIKNYGGEFRKKNPGAQFAAEKFWYPTPESVARLTLEQVRLHKSLDCFKVSARYLYAQDCQVQRFVKKPKLDPNICYADGGISAEGGSAYGGNSQE
jgi:tRNA threonylcarbamoyl adenosine modification protein YeaZ